MNSYRTPDQVPPKRPARETITEIEAELLRVELRTMSDRSVAFGAVGVVVTALGASLGVGSIRLAVGTAGLVLCVHATSTYARMRGHSPALGLLGLTSCIGLFFLFNLSKNCLLCCHKNAPYGTSCDRCSAPLVP